MARTNFQSIDIPFTGDLETVLRSPLFPPFPREDLKLMRSRLAWAIESVSFSALVEKSRGSVRLRAEHSDEVDELRAKEIISAVEDAIRNQVSADVSISESTITELLADGKILAMEKSVIPRQLWTPEAVAIARFGGVKVLCSENAFPLSAFISTEGEVLGLMAARGGVLWTHEGKMGDNCRILDTDGASLAILRESPYHQ